jgi:hypothetical protein
MEFLKYPRTQHIQGSKLQKGDEDLAAVPFISLSDKNVVIEEKMDGANCAISYGEDAKLLLQSRGHYLVGGAGEKHFNLFKQWASTHAECLYDVLGSRYVCYGEWLFAKHTIFYDLLPHFFLEFDIYDRETGVFLSTPRRIELLRELPVFSVRVLFSGELASYQEMASLVGPSGFISDNHLQNLEKQARKLRLSEERTHKETDQSRLMEGLYIKIEEDGVVKERYKFIRNGFLTAVLESESHWLNRPILPNMLQNGACIHEMGRGDV